MRPAVGPGAGLRPGGILGKPVAPVIVLVGRVPLCPSPVRFVDSHQGVQLHPIRVANWATLLPPVAALPSDHPMRNALPNVLRVSCDFDLARLHEREQPLDRRHQLHSIVGRLGIVAEEYPLHRAESQGAGPPSGTGITQTRSVSNQRSLLHRLRHYDAKGWRVLDRFCGLGTASADLNPSG